INYSGQPSDTAKDANIEVYLDSFDSEPVFTIQTPPTTGWSDYKTISLNLTKEQSNKLTGMHDLLLKFKGSEKTYVANVDWFRFAKKININV
ncbi:carbohydrate-binding protein, partial [Alkalihalophilus pseudofirmus]